MHLKNLTFFSSQSWKITYFFFSFWEMFVSFWIKNKIILDLNLKCVWITFGLTVEDNHTFPKLYLRYQHKEVKPVNLSASVAERFADGCRSVLLSGQVELNEHFYSRDRSVASEADSCSSAAQMAMLSSGVNINICFFNMICCWFYQTSEAENHLSGCLL